MDTNQAIAFQKNTVSDVDLSGYGCPECGSPEFKRIMNSTEYRTEECLGAWDKHGNDEITDYGECDYGDSDQHGYDSGYECSDCGNEYDEDEAKLADNFVSDEDEDGSCLAACGDMECAGECRTNAAWPFLGDQGVVRYDALGAQLEALAPGSTRFALEERLGFTVIIADPECRPSAPGNYRENNGPMLCCTICRGDMTTSYARTTHLTFQQERYSDSKGTLTVPMQLRQSICYVCQKG